MEKKKAQFLQNPRSIIALNRAHGTQKHRSALVTSDILGQIVVVPHHMFLTNQLTHANAQMRNNVERSVVGAIMFVIKTQKQENSNVVILLIMNAVLQIKQRLEVMAPPMLYSNVVLVSHIVGELARMENVLMTTIIAVQMENLLKWDIFLMEMLILAVLEHCTRVRKVTAVIYAATAKLKKVIAIIVIAVESAQIPAVVLAPFPKVLEQMVQMNAWNKTLWKL